MTDYCDITPPLLLFVGCFGIAYFIRDWALFEQKPEAKFRWGDKQRRKKSPEGLIGHVSGAMMVLLSIVYTLNYPPCG